MSVALRTSDRVLTAELQRPDAGNAFDETVLAGLGSAVAAARSDAEIRTLVITATGPHFCVGLDRDLLTRAFDDLEYFTDVLSRFGALLTDLETLDVPVVAAVQGTARAAGFELLLACDLVVVAEEARIGDVHTKFGVIPGGGATQRAPRKLGDQRARELIFTSRWLTGAEAVDYGVATTAVPAGDLDAAVAAVTAQLTGKARSCLGAAKRAINRGAGLPLDEALQVELDEFFNYLRTSPDAHEGFRAYLEGRPPSWA